MTFPTAHSQVYRNEEGEIIGWDNTSYDEPDYDPANDDWGPEWDDCEGPDDDGDDNP